MKPLEKEDESKYGYYTKTRQDLPYSIVTAVEFNHQVRDGLVWFLYA